MRRIDPKNLDKNVFTAIGEQWMLITAGTPEKCNTMTASWGGLGVIWNAPAATCYIRPQRYTKEFVDREDFFTLAFFGEESRKALQLCGSKSGRDIDKVKECGFTVKAAECGAPYFEQAQLVSLGKKAAKSQEMEDVDAFVKYFLDTTSYEIPSDIGNVLSRYTADFEQWWRVPRPNVNEW